MSTTARDRALHAALSLVRAGGAVSLDATAAEAGLSKPGLMHHFRTKEALMLALVDHVVDRWESELAARLGLPVERSSQVQRLHAYVQWCLSGHFDEADLAMLCDPRLRQPLIARWSERLRPWCALPPEVPAPQRARLDAARLLADGAWFADATGAFPVPEDEREHLRAIASELLAAAQETR